MQKLLRFSFAYIILLFIATASCYVLSGLHVLLPLLHIVYNVPDIAIDLGTIAYWWLGSISAYCGGEALVSIVTTKNLTHHECDYGNMKKLRTAAIMNYALFILLFILKFLGVNVPVETGFAAIAATTILIVGGKKGVQTAANFQEEDEIKKD